MKELKTVTREDLKTDELKEQIYNVIYNAYKEVREAPTSEAVIIICKAYKEIITEFHPEGDNAQFNSGERIDLINCYGQDGVYTDVEAWELLISWFGEEKTEKIVEKYGYGVPGLEEYLQAEGTETQKSEYAEELKVSLELEAENYADYVIEQAYKEACEYLGINE